MGKRLEGYAVSRVVDFLLQPGMVFVEKNRRKTLFDEMEYVDKNSSDAKEAYDFHWPDFKDSVPGFPDGLIIDKANQVAYFIEVEDTHPLSEDKLDHYATAWFHLDYECWSLRLFVSDRYGSNIREIDVHRWYYDWQPKSVSYG